MRHVASYSSGASSAIATDRALERFPDTEIIFIDTHWEDEDNYRFMHECEQRWGKTITAISDGRTPIEVGTDYKFIPNNKLGVCTKVLKRDLFMDWLAQSDEPATIYIGFDILELDRAERAKKRYADLGYTAEFPLMWKPYPEPPYSNVLLSWGITPPRMYAMGYTHANCGGRCLKQGQGDWLRTLWHWPERFKEVESWESWMRAEVIKGDHAILRKQEGKKIRPLTLEELSTMYQTDQQDMGLLASLDEKTGACIHCSVGDF